MSETKICKYCKTEIPKDAKICPNCRKKQKGKLGIIIAVVVVLLIIGAAAGSGGDKDSSSSTSTKTESASQTETSTTTEEVAEPESEPTIEYTSVSKQELTDALKANALKAADTYKGQYLEISGNLSTIDASGKYIDISSGTDDYSFVYVQCYIKNDDQKAIIMDLNKGDAITVKGKCTDVGELMGYSIDIDEIIVN